VNIKLDSSHAEGAQVPKSAEGIFWGFAARTAMTN
jgi:hypothetical protein